MYDNTESTESSNIYLPELKSADNLSHLGGRETSTCNLYEDEAVEKYDEVTQPLSSALATRKLLMSKKKDHQHHLGGYDILVQEEGLSNAANPGDTNIQEGWKVGNEVSAGHAWGQIAESAGDLKLQTKGVLGTKGLSTPARILNKRN